MVQVYKLTIREKGVSMPYHVSEFGCVGGDAEALALQSKGWRHYAHCDRWRSELRRVGERRPFSIIG